MSPNDTIGSLITKTAETLQILYCEVGLLYGFRALSRENHSLTLESIGLNKSAELTLVRLPRMTESLIQGDWVNSKGAKISVVADRAIISGLVSYPLQLNDEGTVIGIKELLWLESMSGTDVLNFSSDTWWRVRSDDYRFAVTLRTVGGASRRLEDLQADDTLNSLRTRASEEVAEFFNCSAGELVDKLGFCILDRDHRLDLLDNEKTLRDLGISDGTSLLCVR